MSEPSPLVIWIRIQPEDWNKLKRGGVVVLDVGHLLTIPLHINILRERRKKE